MEQYNLWHVAQVVVGRTGDQLLTSETGEITRYDGRFFPNGFSKTLLIINLIPCSHILGMFFRTTRMLEAGIKPVYVILVLPH